MGPLRSFSPTYDPLVESSVLWRSQRRRPPGAGRPSSSPLRRGGPVLRGCCRGTPCSRVLHVSLIQAWSKLSEALILQGLWNVQASRSRGATAVQKKQGASGPNSETSAGVGGRRGPDYTSQSAGRADMDATEHVTGLPWPHLT